MIINSISNYKLTSSGINFLGADKLQDSPVATKKTSEKQKSGSRHLSNPDAYKAMYMSFSKGKTDSVKSQDKQRPGSTCEKVFTIDELFEDLNSADIPPHVKELLEEEEASSDDEDGETSRNFLANCMAYIIAGSQIAAIDIAADRLKPIPDEVKTKNSGIVLFDAEDFIERAEEHIERKEKEFRLKSGLDAHIENKTSEVQNKDAAPVLDEIKEESKRLAENEEFIRTFLDDTKQATLILRSYGLERLSGAIDAYNDRINYALSNAIAAMFDKNPEGVLDSMYSGVLGAPDQKTDNGNGTSTYAYKQGEHSTLYVKKDNRDERIIGAEERNDDEVLFNVDFNEDGSVYDMTYKTNLHKMIILVKPDLDSNTVSIQKESPRGIFKKTFQRRKNGSLWLKSAGML